MQSSVWKSVTGMAPDFFMEMCFFGKSETDAADKFAVGGRLRGMIGRRNVRVCGRGACGRV